MNCAIPWALWPSRLSGPTVSARNRLSCQITRAKNSSGKSWARPAASIIRHTESRKSDTCRSERGIESPTPVMLSAALDLCFNFVFLFVHLKIGSNLTFVAALDGSELALAMKPLAERPERELGR